MTRFLFVLVIAVAVLAPPSAAGTDLTNRAPGLGDYDAPFYPGGSYRSEVRSPGDFLGYRLGSRPTTHHDIVAYFQYLDENFPNAQLHEYGHTYEGRKLVYLVVSSEENMTHLDRIRADLASLADPRTLDGKGAAKRIIENTPAVAWTAYGIHGDELSSGEAAMQLAYQLLAGTDDDTQLLRRELIVCIDPAENPDGRARWVKQLEQWNGVVPSRDTQSLQHTGVWPWGRTNHYLFDLNRDWFSTVHPESRGRTKAVLEWMPQYMLDAHEMGPTDTYLFSPPREPFNPHMVEYIRKWWGKVAEDHAAAFDRYGWSYYTREWNEEFFPGYGSSWGIYLGAVGMLFEQAGVDGSQVRRPEGTVMTFRETVHHQFIGSISNLLTIARGRRELLSDYYGVKLQNVRGDGDKGAAFLFPPGPNTDRIEQLAGKLVDQNIEVETATSSFKVGRLRSSMGENVRNKRFPRGTLIVRTRQPLKQLVEVILDFDIRIPTSFLETEKKEILKHGGTRLYDATAWSLPLAYDVEAYYTTSLPHVGTSPYTTPSRRTGHLSGEETTVGFAFDCSGDRSYHLLARLFERGYKVWCARKPFESAGRLFPRGSFVIRLSGNPHLDVEELRRLSEETGVDVYGAGSGWGGAHADLGGNELGLLAAPRIAIVGGYPTSSYTFGSVWHLLDNQFRMRCSTIDAARIARSDLDKYNAVVLPDAWGGAALLKRVVGDAGIKRLGEWVEDGGTLIAMGNGAAMLADTSVGLTSVRLRRQSLSKLRSYDLALSAEREAESPAVDSLDVWEGKEEAPNEVSHAKTDKAILEAKDAEARMLHPRGAMLSVNADTEHWLTAGCGARVPVLLTGDYAYLAKRPVAVVGRFSDASRLRIAGLCWPEARDRWAQTAYLTREARGKGQVILFASQPNFRGYFLGSERLLLNAMLLGPGMGTRRAIEW